jgi:cytochrome P450
MEMVRERRA